QGAVPIPHACPKGTRQLPGATGPRLLCTPALGLDERGAKEVVAIVGVGQYLVDASRVGRRAVQAVEEGSVVATPTVLLNRDQHFLESALITGPSGGRGPSQVFVRRDQVVVPAGNRRQLEQGRAVVGTQPQDQRQVRPGGLEILGANRVVRVSA